MSKLSKILLWSILIGLLFPGSTLAQSQDSDSLIIGTKHTPPFVIKGEDGSWTGITIDLWTEIARELELNYKYDETDLKGLIDGLQDGTLDASVAALTITSEREHVIDFTHPFYNTGLGIATITKGEGTITRALSRVLSFQFFKVVFALVVVLLFIGILVWLFERKKNKKQFGGGFLRGVGHSFWWSAVTMTTVGYGDKAPTTFGGRLIGFVWMFTAIIIISSFTATITSVLTVSQLESPVNGPEDLPRVKVGTVAGSSPALYLDNNKIRYRNYESPIEGLRALEAGTIDAMVYDEPILRYLVNTSLSNKIRVLPNIFENQDYGIGLPEQSNLRERINRIILKKTHEPWWQDILRKYIGD
ncbi:MAG: transporter substrate-binding domain-containing protein [candidate division Zixibacteria bacterium]|nr:transporter substrate-binding domain-containing protein [candidate division Zixibacteria bacterium]